MAAALGGDPIAPHPGGRVSEWVPTPTSLAGLSKAQPQDTPLQTHSAIPLLPLSLLSFQGSAQALSSRGRVPGPWPSLELAPQMLQHHLGEGAEGAG